MVWAYTLHSLMLKNIASPLVILKFLQLTSLHLQIPSKFVDVFASSYLESVHIHINKASPTECFLFALWWKWWLWFFWSRGCIVNQNILQQSICRRFSFQEDGPMSFCFRNPTMYTDFLCIHRNVGTNHSE